MRKVPRMVPQLHLNYRRVRAAVVPYKERSAGPNE